MLLLLLHHMLPHQHHGQLATAMHIQEHNSTHLTDILRTVFHEVAPNIDAGQYQTSEEKDIIIRAAATQNYDFTAHLFLYTCLESILQREYYQRLLAHYQIKIVASYQSSTMLWRDFKAHLPIYCNTCVIFRAPPALA